MSPVTGARPGQKDLLLAFYGDDFTGSTDAMESLAKIGLRTVLFLKAPTPAQLRRFGGLRAFGIAGTSRTMTPEEMRKELPPIFRALKAAGAPLVHYKICSTFDSSPRIGSVGQALDLADRIFRPTFIPLLVGAPALGRYSVFGNLFARSGLDSEPHRLDRHPTMAQHPTTPMNEADLRLHLGRQTRQSIGLLDLVHLEGPDPAARLRQLQADGARIILLDVASDRHLPRLGELLSSSARPGRSSFLAGSSCVEYALAAWWRESGALRLTSKQLKLPSAPGLIVVSGSCAPVTERQIRRALAAGFAEIGLDTAALAGPATRSKALARALSQAAPHFEAGRSVLFHTARGPEDPRLGRTARVLRRHGLRAAPVLGAALGELLALAMQQTGWKRGVVTGGDTSSFAARALGIEALEFAAPIAPGAPLCRVHAPGQIADGREIVFKGGQNGKDDFLLHTLKGDAAE